ncbi:MAG TPA: helix-turn-helix domain-containing protein [Candidatus Limnocylindrales bacterium]|nr:helix-turn-helix domain-containing protein [Candidatus Limnocylindrales bacterium]
MVKLEQRLKEARIQRGLTIEQVAKATKIKAHFLESIEKGAYSELPSPAYAKGFVRNYAEFLGLPKAQSSALFKRDFDEKKNVKVLPDGMVKNNDFPIRRINLRKAIIGTIVLILLGTFLMFQVRGVLFAPSIFISSPKGNTITQRDISVIGRTDSSATITINNESVFVNNNGVFEKKISLFPGENVITIKAKNRFGKQSTLQRTVLVKQ